MMADASTAGNAPADEREQIILDGIFRPSMIAVWRIGQDYIAARTEEEALRYYLEQTQVEEEEARKGEYPEKVSARDMDRFVFADSEHELVSTKVGDEVELSWRSTLELRVRAGEPPPFTFATSFP